MPFNLQSITKYNNWRKKNLRLHCIRQRQHMHLILPSNAFNINVQMKLSHPRNYCLLIKYILHNTKSLGKKDQQDVWNPNRPARSQRPSQHGKQGPLSESGSTPLRTKAERRISTTQLRQKSIQKDNIFGQELITCPPESLDTGETAKDITGSGTFIEVMVYLTEPSVKVSPDKMSK